jgi:hypothetical protein
MSSLQSRGPTAYSRILTTLAELPVPTRLGWRDYEKEQDNIEAKFPHEVGGGSRHCLMSFSLLGSEGRQKWRQHSEGLTVNLPASKRLEYAFVFRIDLELRTSCSTFGVTWESKTAVGRVSFPKVDDSSRRDGRRVAFSGRMC